MEEKMEGKTKNEVKMGEKVVAVTFLRERVECPQWSRSTSRGITGFYYK
jgi:hypothetical protein